MPCIRGASVPAADFESASVPVRGGSAPPDSPWSGAPALLPVAEEESVVDWHLNAYGLFCRDRERLADADIDEEIPADRRKWPHHVHPINPIYYRPHFQQLVTFLPMCNGFEHVFKPSRHRKGWFRRTGRVFWVVDNVPQVFRTSGEAEAAWVAEGDPWGAIWATPSFSFALEHVQDMFGSLP
ncbi:hypothetical protein MSAN_01948600 [Mycena sanguinolenta]|uniref:Uncharacterized protein n=1 Tax=Mycena sanguinolenta TaxID=230812 RepID=A0A8H6XNK8_9AGAR|nr:hypothetical protein MSAN_01948600 [Mycena sanguinolenta]